MADDNRTVSVDALTPAEITDKVLSVARVKANLPFARQLPLTFLAGVYIGLGAIFCALFQGDATLSYSVQKFMAGAVFSLGLSLVMTAGAELYTGNTMMAAGAADGRISWGETVMNWVRVWVGNGLGAVALALVVWLSHAAETGTAGVGLMTIAAGKMSAPWWTVFWKGVLCNLLVCLGVWMAYAGRSVTDRCVGVLLPVAAFVALGFEHCVANLFFLPMALLLKASGFAPEGVNLEAIQFSALWVNLSAATLGNTVAGAGLALLYRQAYGKRAAK